MIFTTWLSEEVREDRLSVASLLDSTADSLSPSADEFSFLLASPRCAFDHFVCIFLYCLSLSLKSKTNKKVKKDLYCKQENLKENESSHHWFLGFISAV